MNNWMLSIEQHNYDIINGRQNVASIKREITFSFILFNYRLCISSKENGTHDDHAVIIKADGLQTCNSIKWLYDAE